MFVPSILRIMLRILLLVLCIEFERVIGTTVLSFFLLLFFHSYFKKGQRQWFLYTGIVDVLSFRPLGLTFLVLEVVLVLLHFLFIRLPIVGKNRVPREVM